MVYRESLFGGGEGSEINDNGKSVSTDVFLTREGQEWLLGEWHITVTHWVA